ncbi:Ig-like domain-containing protein [Intrasporangium mesophilum]
MASTVVVALVAGLLVWLATRSDGEVARKADLNDGGIWVTNAEQARFGRINKAAGQLDAGVLSDATSGAGLDVLQDGAAVLGFSRASNQVVPINPAEATLAPEQSAVVPSPSTATGNRVFTAPLVDLRGGTVAMVDPAKGEVRAQRVDNRAGITALDGLQTQAKPLAKVGANAAVAVGVDGTVYAVSAAAGVLATIHPEGTGFAKPVLTTISGLDSKSAQVTAVGSHWVVWDSGTGRLWSDALTEPEQLAIGGTRPGNPAYAALQQPGPDAPTVLVQDETRLTQVSLTGDTPRVGGVAIAQVGAGQQLFLSQPVRLASCVHGAWAGPANVYYGRNCGSPDDAATVDLGAMTKGVRTDGVKLRVNRGLIVLNDLDSGDVWDVDRNRVKIDNWNSVIPPPQTDDRNKKKDENLVDDQVTRTPPKAMPDTVQVRPGRTSTLHVLDNDSDSQGSILAIAPGDVGSSSVPGIATSASADGQTVQVTVPEEPSAGSFTFEYTVNNGTTAKNGRATAKVTVRIVGPDVNTAPRLRTGQAKLADAKYPVVASGSVRVGVVADWRDAESDPIQVSAVDPATTGVDGSGALTVKAQAEAGDQAVEYVVDDGRGGSQKSSVTLDVLSEDESKPVPPKTQPDVVRAVVGKPVQLQPLGNDIAGADPTDPGARMRLAQAVKGPGQLVLDTNLDTNVLTVTGQTPGTSTVTYAAQVGSGVSVGRVRVDILPNPSTDLPPVATPDAAVVRGQTPVIADVLSNDYSPRSDVLVVQRVESPQAWLRASVVQGRWVRVVATAPVTGQETRQGTVRYTISDGTKTAVGELSVVQKPEPKEKVLPTVVDDVAIVRVGDAVTIPALDNDSMSEGIPLRLDPNVRVLSGGGQAFASGTVVRYVPEQGAMTGPRTAILEYTTYPEGQRARAVTGRITVTVTPLPDPVKNPNQPPSARSFTASVTAGDTLTITVPTSGVDPDGDLAFVGGIVGENGQAVDLEYGRVLGFGAATIRYEAYPRSSGTEVIRYQLRDRFGLTSEGFVRVGVVQPGDPQPPVAVEDDVVAAPGRTVHADVLANDLIAAGDSVDFVDFASLNDADTLRQFQRQADDTFKVVAPEEGPAKVLTYGITDGLFDPSKSTLTVRGQKDFNNPPTAVDDTAVAKSGETSVLVDALANDRDIDGDQASLKITRFVGDGVTREGRKLRIQLRPQARVVPYVIEDADGAAAMALIYVPAGNNGLPYAVDGKVIKMGADSTVTVSLGDYVADPRGGRVSVTSPDTVSTSPSDDLQFDLTSATELSLTSTNGYVGPAALMLEVTNSTGINDKSAQRAYVTVPVQIGPDVPVLRCPDHEVLLAADGPARTFDIPRLCHAWLPTGMDDSTAQYAATWDPAADRVGLAQSGAGGRQVSLKAEAGAQAGTTGAVRVMAKGSAESFLIRVRVTSAPPIATMRPVLVEGLIAGTRRAVNLGQYLDSPLTAPQCSLQESDVTSGTGVTASANGCQLTVAASDRARGDATITVRVLDAPGRPAAIGQVRVTVRSKPDPTGAPVAVADRILGSTARVDWRPPAYDGGLPIQQYEVIANGGEVRQICPSSPCTITGLTNGKDYSFAVRSRNAVDWSEPSPPSNTVRPDTKPKATAVTTVVPGDQRLTVSWSEPPNDGSPVSRYRIQWVDIGGNAGATGSAEVAAPGLTKTITGLINNDAYNVRVQAKNEAGWGPFGPDVKAQSFGKPANVPAPTLAPRTPTPGEPNAQVQITWPATDPNGPPITKYDVYRRMDGGAWTLIGTRSGGESRVESDTIPFQGQQVEYTVTATNGGPATSDRANISSYSANGIPETPRLTSVVTPSANYAANAAFSLGDSRSRGYGSVNWRTSGGRSGSWACSGGCSGGTATFLGTSQQSMEIQACNAAGLCSPWSNNVSFQAYGPTNGVPNLRETHDDNSITFTWGTAPNEGRPVTGYEIDGDRNATVGAGTRSTTFGGLGYSTTRTIRVRAIAQDSGPGPWTAFVSGTTNPKPQPKVVSVYHGSQCGTNNCFDPVQGRQCGTNCYHIGYTLQDFATPISCAVSGWSLPDNGNSGTIEPSNGANNSGKFLGYPNQSVTVTCTGSDGRSDSFTKNPWG